MSVQEVKTKSSEEIQKELAQLCFRAGQLAYGIRCNQKDLELVYGTIQSLDLEYAAAKNEEQSKQEPKTNE